MMIKDKTVRIGIVSVDVNTPMFNYGAILHTWAFEKFLRKNGYCNIETLDYYPESIEFQNRVFPFLDLITDCHRKLSLFYCTHYFEYIKKYKVIQKFISNEITLSPIKYRYSTIQEKMLPYDILIAEDDVIWSPHFLCRKDIVDKTFFLAHHNMDGIKKIAYAPSMAQCNYEKNECSVIKSYLENFDAISVREMYEKRFIKESMNIEVDQCVDAVFLLEAEEYMPIISDKFKGEKYVLLYLPADDNLELRKAAQEKATELGLKVVEISNKICSHKNVYGDASVQDFLSGIYYAAFVFTNSFHAVCFSLIFKKQFYVFSRANSGKLMDICTLFELEERYNHYADFKYKEIDYKKVESRRQTLSEFARKWILSAIEDAKND